MAKQAKQVELEISDKVVRKFVSDFLEHHENIEDARNKMRRETEIEREAMKTLFETMAARGIPQRVTKLHVKIVLMLEKVQGWITELEDEDKRTAKRMAKAQGDPRQLNMFPDDPPAKKPASKRKLPEADLEATEAAGIA